MRYNEFDNIHDLATAMEKAEGEHKWTHDPVLYRAIIYTGVICGKFELITNKSMWPTTGCIVVCTEYNRPYFQHDSCHTWYVLEDGVAEEICRRYDSNEDTE